MVFSPNSRFLAVTELTGGLQQFYRVVVFDFVGGKQIIAHEEKSEKPEDLGIISFLRWVDDSTLRIGTFSSDHEERERSWRYA